MSKAPKLSSIGNFTKNAVQDFEHNIISQKDYLEKVENNKNKNIKDTKYTFNVFK